MIQGLSSWSQSDIRSVGGETEHAYRAHISAVAPVDISLLVLTNSYVPSEAAMATDAFKHFHQAGWSYAKCANMQYSLHNARVAVVIWLMIAKTVANISQGTASRSEATSLSVSICAEARRNAHRPPGRNTTRQHRRTSSRVAAIGMFVVAYAATRQADDRQAPIHVQL